MFRAFVMLSEETEWYQYYHTEGACASKHGSGNPGLTVFSKHAEPNQYLGGLLEKKPLVNWLKKVGLCHFCALDDDMLNAVFTDGYEILILFHQDKSTSYFKEFEKAT